MAKACSGTIQISRRGVLVWTGLFLFVAVWMFVLGIMVGRGTAPVDLEKDKLVQELAARKAEILARERSRVEEQVSGEPGEQPQLGFYEALKNPGDEKRMKIPDLPKPRPEAVAGSAPRPEEKNAAVKPPAPVEKAPPTTDPKPQKAAPAPSSSGDRFTVQVAAVQDVQGATGLVNRLRKKGYRAYQIRSEVAGKGVWYRVRVGAYPSRQAAEAAMKKLKNDRYKGIIVHTR